MLQKRLNIEQGDNEQKKKQKIEGHFYTIIKVARDEDLTQQIGRDIYFDLVDHDKVKSFRVPNQMTFNVVKEGLAKAFGVPVEFQRFWLWAKRQNQTYRPNRPLTHLEEAQAVGNLREVPTRHHNAELKLFLEVQLGPDWLPHSPPVKTKDDILLFFKLYDPKKEELCYVGRLLVKGTSKPTVILTTLNVMAGFAPDEEIELYEEIRIEPAVMCEPINKKLSFRANQLEDGDIICIQKSHSADNCPQFRNPDVPSFFEYMSWRQFRQTHDMLYYEDIPLPELQDLRTLEVAFHHATGDEVTIHSIRLPTQRTVGDVLNYLKTKVEPSHPEAQLRLLEVFYHKIYKIFPASEKIEYINDQYWKLRAEEIPEEEKNLGRHGRLIHVYHFRKETALDQMHIQNFGEPFLLGIHEGETLAAVKKRIKRKLRVSDAEFAKWKFSLVTLCRLEYLEDTDNLSSRFQKSGVYGAWEQYLGLEHADNAPKRSHAANQIVHFRSLEKPKEDDFCLELSKLNTYDEVVGRVAQQLGLEDPSKIRLTSHNCWSQQPEPQAIKYQGVENLSDMLVNDNQTSNILYYEVLDIPLPELQGLKTLIVAFRHATRDEVTVHPIRLPKQSIVSDVINDLKTKVDLSHPDVELRLLEVFCSKIYKIFPASEKIENINDQYLTLHAEEIPEEEKSLGPHECLIHVYHFTKETVQNQMRIQNFGEPFFLVIHEGETLAEVKKRIQKKLRVSEEEFPEWKFAFMALGQPEYLEDTEIPFSRFQRRGVYGWDQYLGLEHAANAPKRSHAANQPSRRHTSTGQEEALIEERGFTQSSPHSEGTFDSTELADFDRLLESESYSVQEIMGEELAPTENSQFKPSNDLDRAKVIIKEVISKPMKEGLSDGMVSKLASVAELLLSNQPELGNCLKSVFNGSLKSRLEFTERLFATSEDGLFRLQETLEKADIARAKYKVARDSNIAASAERAELQKQIDSTEEEIHQLQEKLSGLKEKKLQVDDRASHFKKQLSSLGNNMKSEVVVLRELQKSQSQWVAQKTMAEKEFIELEAEWNQLREAFL